MHSSCVVCFHVFCCCRYRCFKSKIIQLIRRVRLISRTLKVQFIFLMQKVIYYTLLRATLQADQTSHIKIIQNILRIIFNHYHYQFDNIIVNTIIPGRSSTSNNLTESPFPSCLHFMSSIKKALRSKEVLAFQIYYSYFFSPQISFKYFRNSHVLGTTINYTSAKI